MTSESTSARTAPAVGSLVGAVAVAACCVLPFVLFTLGASGAWTGTLVRLAPLQPYFLAATIVCLGCGYWLVDRSGRVACAAGRNCRTPAMDKRIKVTLVLATTLVVVAIGFKFLIPLLDL